MACECMTHMYEYIQGVRIKIKRKCKLLKKLYEKKVPDKKMNDFKKIIYHFLNGIIQF